MTKPVITNAIVDAIEGVGKWREKLTPAEAERLDEIEIAKAELRKEARKIFDRARKRAERN